MNATSTVPATSAGNGSHCSILHGDSPACPRCRTAGHAVCGETVDNWVMPQMREKLGCGPFFTCRYSHCAVVYFTASGLTASVAEVHPRVGWKTGRGPTPLCYCFGHTVESIESEIRVTGASRAVELISAEIKAGNCACETKNPEGRCCLGEVSETVKAVEDLLSCQRLREAECEIPLACEQSVRAAGGS